MELKIKVSDFQSFTGIEDIAKEFEGLDEAQATSKLKELFTSNLSRIAKQSKRATMTDFESEIKTKYGIDSTQQGESLIATLIDAEQSKYKELKGQFEVLKNTKKSSDWTEQEQQDYIKNNPFFKTTIEGFKTQIAESENKFVQRENEYKQAELKNVVLKQLSNEFDSLNVVLSSDAKKAQRQKELFFNAFMDQYNFALNEQGKVIAIDGQGNELQDAKFNAVKFSELAKQSVLGTFDIHAIDPKKGSPNGQGNGQGQGKIFDFSTASNDEIFSHVKSLPIEQRAKAQEEAKQYLK